MQWFEEPQVADALAEAARPSSPAPGKPGRNPSFQLGMLIGLAIVIVAMLIRWF